MGPTPKLLRESALRLLPAEYSMPAAGKRVDPAAYTGNSAKLGASLPHDASSALHSRRASHIQSRRTGRCDSPNYTQNLI